MEQYQNSNSIYALPNQKVSDAKKKSIDWIKRNLDVADSITSLDDGEMRVSYTRMQENYNLFRGILNIQQLEPILNPQRIENFSLMENIKHIGLGNNKIRLLLGEEIKRRFDWRVTISSHDQLGISLKQESLKELWLQNLQDIIKNAPEDKIEKLLMDAERYAKHDWQHIHEKQAQTLLSYHYKKLEIKDKFSSCFTDGLIAGVQWMYVGDAGRNVIAEKVDPREMFTLGGYSSPYGEDADIIIRKRYRSINKILDDYIDDLSKTDRDKLIAAQQLHLAGGSLYGGGIQLDIPVNAYTDGMLGNTLYAPNSNATFAYGSFFNTRGEIREVHQCWRSKRKVQIVKFINDRGVYEEKFVHGDYVIDEFIGEEIVKTLWINEWMEGTKIGPDIYIRVRPVPYQGKDLLNPSLSTPPYIGTYYGEYGNATQSMMDIIKHLDISYDIYFHKREHEITTHFGSILAYNMSMVPAGWDPDKWMNYIISKKFLALDPTNEILKGPSEGKAAGAFNQLTAQSLQFDNSGTIRMLTEIMQDIEDKLGKLSGVTNSREGQISQYQAVSNTNAEITQTSHITEPWFNVHDNFKRRVLRKLLQVAKYNFKKYPQKAAFIMDEAGLAWLSDSVDFTDCSYDVHVTSSFKETEAHEFIKELAVMGVQSGQVSLFEASQVALTENTSTLTNKLRELQEKAEADAEAQKQHEQELLQQEIEAEEVRDLREHEQTLEEWDRKEQIELIKIQALKELETLRKVLKSDDTTDEFKKQFDLQKLEIESKKLEESVNLKRDELKAAREEKKKERDLKYKIHREKLNADRLKKVESNSKKNK